MTQLPDWLTPVLVVAGVSLLLTIGGLIYKAGSWMEGLRTDRKNFAKGIETNQRSIAEIAREIREDIKKILIRIPGSTVESQSPARLSEYGQRISHSMRAEEWARDLAPSLVPQVTGKPEFAVEEFCRSYVEEHLATSNMVLKAMYDFGTTRDNVLAVPRIVLRDELLRIREQGRPRPAPPQHPASKDRGISR